MEHTVQLQDGTIGKIDFEGDITLLIGELVTVHLHDENGMPLAARGVLVCEL